MMTVFSDVMSAPVEGDGRASREDILHLCRLFREDRVARMSYKDLAEFRKAA